MSIKTKKTWGVILPYKNVILSMDSKFLLASSDEINFADAMILNLLIPKKRAYKCQFVKTILCGLNLNSYFKEVCPISMHQRTKKVELQMINCSGIALILYTKYTKSKKEWLIRFYNHNMNKDNTKREKISDSYCKVVNSS